jgi:hypothetical protein
MPTDPTFERRSQPRFLASHLSAQLRLKGQFSRVAIDVLDFNRHGLAIRFDRPLPKDQLVYLTLEFGDVILERVIGIVHNCLAQQQGYRCGILFRTQSILQFDREQVEASLSQIESGISGQKASLPPADGVAVKRL